MKIAFFTENTHCGGLDTFLVTLINNWPHREDDLAIICNASHPGLRIIEQRLNRPCKLFQHRISIYADFVRDCEQFAIVHWLRRFLSPLLRLCFFIGNTIALMRLFKSCGSDHLMVVSGGYPGGDSCRAAVIAWGTMKNRSASIFNYHNLALAPRWFEKVAEYVIDRILVRCCRAVITVSRAAAESMRVRPSIWESGKVAHVYNGVDGAGCCAGKKSDGLAAELNLPRNALICLMLGTYEPRKGHYFLMTAFRRVVEKIPTAYLVVCGYGYPKEVEVVRALVGDFGLTSNVRLLGFRNDVCHLLSSARVLLISSQVFESFGLTAVEAMAHRVPVVATAVGGIPEVVVNGEGGFCWAPNDAEGYAGCVIGLLQNKTLAQEQGEKGYRCYQEFFTASRMAQNYAQLICGS